jgi:hypothetical protein
MSSNRFMMASPFKTGIKLPVARRVASRQVAAIPSQKADMKSWAVFALVLMAGGACGGGESDGRQGAGGDTLTQRQRDSMLSTSRIPGASGVGKAMKVADSTSARVQAADTVGP